MNKPQNGMGSLEYGIWKFAGCVIFLVFALGFCVMH